MHRLQFAYLDLLLCLPCVPHLSTNPTNKCKPLSCECVWMCECLTCTRLLTVRRRLQSGRTSGSFDSSWLVSHRKPAVNVRSIPLPGEIVTKANDDKQILVSILWKFVIGKGWKEMVTYMFIFSWTLRHSLGVNWGNTEGTKSGFEGSMDTFPVQKPTVMVRRRH